MNHKPRVAIVGLGRIGQALAQNLAVTGRQFYAVDVDTGKLEKLSGSWQGHGHISDLDTALVHSDIVVLSILFVQIEHFLKENAGKLTGKIIIDPSNPLSIDATGVFSKAIADDLSSGVLHQAALPPEAKMAKAFCSLSCQSLAKESFRDPDPVGLLYANDDRSIDGIIEELIYDLGFAPLRLGGIDQSIRMEVFGDLNGVMIGDRLPSVTELKTLL